MVLLKCFFIYKERKNKQLPNEIKKKRNIQLHTRRILLMNYHNIVHEDMTPIPDFEDYLINRKGEVYSKKTNKFLKPWLDSKGYLQVQLFKNGNKYSFKVHRLVAIVFLPNPNNLPEVNHKDENKQNPNLDNLEWCTVEYNNNYGTRGYRISQSNKKSLLRKRKSILQLDSNLNIIREYDTIERVKDFGFCQPNVIAVLKNRRKTTGGFSFIYKEDFANELS